MGVESAGQVAGRQANPKPERKDTENGEPKHLPFLTMLFLGVLLEPSPGKEKEDHGHTQEAYPGPYHEEGGHTLVSRQGADHVRAAQLIDTRDVFGIHGPEDTPGISRPRQPFYAHSVAWPR